LAGEHTTGTPFNLDGPCGLDIIGRHFLVVEAGEKPGCDIRALVDRKRERFAKKFLRALSHAVILASSLLSNSRWSRQREPASFDVALRLSASVRHTT
jgi:hypothetical protein